MVRRLGKGKKDQYTNKSVNLAIGESSKYIRTVALR